MLHFEELLSKLGYDNSLHYHSLTDPPPYDETAHLFRAARDAKVSGIYVFETSPGSPQGNLLPTHPAVYVAKASTETEAREIHRKLWNLSYAPFIIILLPHQIRLYTGFDYSVDEEKAGLLGKVSDSEPKHLERLRDLLASFTANSIDSGHIWNKYAKSLNVSQRVDERLLKNLDQLGKALQELGLHNKVVAHALIGKYVYLRYLRDRGILKNIWLADLGIEPNDVFSFQATVRGLQSLVEALEARVNGKIFPLDFQKAGELKDEHVSLVASVFLGSEIVDLEKAPTVIQQLHLPFKAYEFKYIPIEILSTIYEQFIHSQEKERKKKGVIYTPEILADYLLSEIEWVRPLKRGMKILDPACGSGVFLVLAYRRLVEKELRQREREKLKPEELRTILLESIYGIEREQDACYVTELSLILTLLHYAEPHYLHNLEFEFPELHNKRIFQGDFFDIEGEKSEIQFWQMGLDFDYIVGNPPWIKSSPQEEKYADAWIQNVENQDERPVGDKSVAEAFSWAVTDLLSPDGIVGLVMPATSLFNLRSQKYRRAFFNKCEVLRITNFANQRDILFANRSTLPAATFVYRQPESMHDKSPIIHYGPFTINQIVTNRKKKPWTLTINENEIRTISASEAEEGETALWKLALWGTHFDKRAIERIEYLFPKTLKEICDEKDWPFYEGGQLRDSTEESRDELEYIAELGGKKRFLTDSMRNSPFRFSIPSNALGDIPDEMCYIRKRGGKAGLELTSAPHIILSPVWMSYVLYSDADFVIPPRTIGIAASKKDKAHLKSLATYLNSSLVAYYLFFHAQQWGIFRQARLVSIAEVRKIPVPEFTQDQIEKLALLWDQLGEIENQRIVNFASNLRKGIQESLDINYTQENTSQSIIPGGLASSQKSKLRSSITRLQQDLQVKIDEELYEILKIPEDIRLLVKDFIEIRLPLDRSSSVQKATKRPTEQDLLAYARELQTELDGFLRGSAYHKIAITSSEELIECIIEITQEKQSFPTTKDNIRLDNSKTAELLTEINQQLRNQVSQWVYVQRGLRLFDDSRIHIYRAPRLIDWTRTQAVIDAADVIGELVVEGLKS